MEKQNKRLRSRREFLGTAITATAAFSLLPLSYRYSNASQDEASKRPNSDFGGVQIGAISASWRNEIGFVTLVPNSAERLLEYCIQSGISSIELMSEVAEQYAGAPANPSSQGGGPPGASGPAPGGSGEGSASAPGGPTGQSGAPQGAFSGAPGPGGQTPGATEGPSGQTPGAPAMGAMPQRQQMTPEQQAANAKYAAELKAWRLSSTPMKRYEELRKVYNNAGVGIHIVKFSPANWSDEESDYAFKAAKVLGAKGVTEEIGDAACKRLGPIAEKHGMYAVFHNHFEYAEKGFDVDRCLGYSPANMLNFDTGHYFGSTGLDPVAFIKKYHDRILSLHLKDKTGPNSNPANTGMPFGKGETPNAEILLLIKKEKWPIYCDIELEYDIPQGSTMADEVKKSVDYLRSILTQ